jgi:flavin reductase (DIM6/NTAB) family NADH-FMN oxidoreductase RutF
MVSHNKVDQPRQHWDRLFATPGQLALITTVDNAGTVNAGAFATCVRVVHEPCQIAFTTSTTGKDTYTNIKANGQFVVNLPSFDRQLLEKVTVVGLRFPPGVDELNKAGLTALPSKLVKPPRIAECHRHFECELVWMKEWVGRVMIVGNVVAASVDKDCVDERGFIKWERIKPVHYCGSPYLKRDPRPPHKHMFVACYETIAVDTPYDGPELDTLNAMVERMEEVEL